MCASVSEMIQELKSYCLSNYGRAYLKEQNLRLRFKTPTHYFVSKRKPALGIVGQPLRPRMAVIYILILHRIFYLTSKIYLGSTRTSRQSEDSVLTRFRNTLSGTENDDSTISQEWKRSSSEINSEIISDIKRRSSFTPSYDIATWNHPENLGQHTSISIWLPTNSNENTLNVKIYWRRNQYAG